MKTLASPRDKEEILHRLSAIGLASKRRWGKMSAPEMVCHLSDAFRVSLGEKDAKLLRFWFPRSFFKWAALQLPLQWPQGVKTVPECDAKLGGTPPGEIENDLSELRRLIERFAEQPVGAEWPAHPIFGYMAGEEWMRWGYLHVDHHLRQFGA